MLGVVGVFVPLLAVVGSLRLARPASPWSRRWYDDRRLARSKERFPPGRRNRWDGLVDLFATVPGDAPAGTGRELSVCPPPWTPNGNRTPPDVDAGTGGRPVHRRPARDRTGRGYGRGVDDLETAVDRIAAAAGFSGVVRVDRGGRMELAKPYGSAHRGYGIPNTVDTRFGLASGTKSLTALSIVSLIEEGRLDLDTTARSVLGEDLPLIDDGVTVEHLLAHRSGIGDYFDEDAVESMTDYVMPVPVHRLATTADYLAVLDGYQQLFPPGERFAYNNGGFVVLALIAERAGGTPFADVVDARVRAGRHARHRVPALGRAR